MSDKNVGDQTTGHLWDDDLADLTNQPPKMVDAGAGRKCNLCGGVLDLVSIGTVANSE